MSPILVENSSDADVLPQKIDDYFELEYEHSNKVKFGVNVAKDMVETSLHNEVIMVLNGCWHIFKKEKPSVHDLFGHFFGEDSVIVKHLKYQLSVDYIMILKLLHTISVMQSYRLSSSQLYDKNSLIDKEVINLSSCN